VIADLPLTAFDLAAIAIVVLSTLFALLRGALREALTLAVWGGAAVVAWYGFEHVQPLTRQTFDNEVMADVTAAAVAFIVPLIAFKIVAAVLAARIPDRGPLVQIDRLLGGLFGLARGALIVCIAWLGLTVMVEPGEEPEWLREARLRPWVEDGAAWLERLLPEPRPTEQAAAPPRLRPAV
jgi:membrane protein required for colicin V production